MKLAVRAARMTWRAGNLLGVAAGIPGNWGHCAVFGRGGDAGGEVARELHRAEHLQPFGIDRGQDRGVGRVDTTGALEDGAHLLLQIRTRVLNDTLTDDYRRWYPGLTHTTDQEHLAA